MPLGTAGNYPVAKLLAQAIAANKDPAVGEILKKCKYMNDGLDEYLTKICSEQTPLQKKIFDDTCSTDWGKLREKGLIEDVMSPEAMSGKTEGQFLKTICELIKAERILEVGMFTGHSAASFCESQYSKEVVSLEIEPYFEKFVAERTHGTPADKKLRIILGPALNGLERLRSEGRTFDLVFIDADKLNYPNYYKFIMDHNLLTPGGVILVDNALYFGSVYPVPSSEEGQAIAEMNEMVRNDERVEQVLVPIRDGVLLIHSKQK